MLPKDLLKYARMLDSREIEHEIRNTITGRKSVADFFADQVHQFTEQQRLLRQMHNALPTLTPWVDSTSSPGTFTTTNVTYSYQS